MGLAWRSIGLFTTALFFTHAVMQMPGGRASDRFGGRRMGLLALAWYRGLQRARRSSRRSSALALATAGADRVRHRALLHRRQRLRARERRLAVRAGPLRRRSGSPGGGLALAIVPPVERLDRLAGAVRDGASRSRSSGSLVLAGPARSRPGSRSSTRRRPRRSIFRDRRPLQRSRRALRRLARAQHHDRQLGRHAAPARRRPRQGAAGVIGALTLVLGVVTRPLGGWILHARPGAVRARRRAEPGRGRRRHRAARGRRSLRRSRPLGRR